MALVDFYQLVVLYKLACGDLGARPNHSLSPLMFSPTTHPSSPSPQAGDTQPPPSVNAPAPEPSPHLVPASPPLSSPSLCPRQPSPPPVDLQPQLSTPQKSRTFASSLLDITPLSKGSDLETEADCAGKYDSADYVQSITQDFINHRVFISIEDFMKNVLHVPDDWESEWNPTILKIKGDDDFDYCWRKYCDQCDDSGVSEESFYELLVEMVNTVLELAEHSESTKPQTPQRYIRNDPKKLFCGVLNEAHLSPDVATIHRDLLTYLEPSEGVSGKLTEPYLTWAHPLHVLEVKHFDNALIDGSRLPRLKAEGKATTPCCLCPATNWRPQDETHKLGMLTVQGSRGSGGPIPLAYRRANQPQLL